MIDFEQTKNNVNEIKKITEQIDIITNEITETEEKIDKKLLTVTSSISSKRIKVALSKRSHYGNIEYATISKNGIGKVREYERKSHYNLEDMVDILNDERAVLNLSIQLPNRSGIETFNSLVKIFKGKEYITGKTIDMEIPIKINSNLENLSEFQTSRYVENTYINKITITAYNQHISELGDINCAPVFLLIHFHYRLVKNGYESLLELVKKRQKEVNELNTKIKEEFAHIFLINGL